MAVFRVLGNGSELIANTSARTGKAYETLIVQEDTVISVLTGGNDSTDDNSTNYLTEQGLSGATLKQGAIISAPVGQVFKSLTLTSGSLIAYKG